MVSAKLTRWYQDELFAFYQAHFSDDAVAHFGGDFLNVKFKDEEQEPFDEEWDEDDLGYYEDGVKRTLTDEQIEIFRHSELQMLRRQQEKDSLKRKSNSDSSSETAIKHPEGSSDLQESSLPSSFRSNKKRKKKGASTRQNAEPKPDLRKRTWDVVDKGLDTLDYD